MRTVVYPGSFDPCTNGHLDIIERSSRLFDKVVVAVLVNSAKHPLFSVEERIALLRIAVKDLPNVEIRSFSGLLIDFMKEIHADMIIKGIRAVSDFEYEFQMSLTNKKLNPNLETVFLTSSAENMYLSSSIVKQVASLGGDITNFVPECIHDEIKERLYSK